MNNIDKRLKRYNKMLLVSLKGKINKKEIASINDVIVKTIAHFESLEKLCNKNKKRDIDELTVKIWPDKSSDEKVYSISLKERVPTETGPNRRPVECGYEWTYCYTLFGITICITISVSGPC